jgi:hypothetical protein
MLAAIVLALSMVIPLLGACSRHPGTTRAQADRALDLYFSSFGAQDFAKVPFSSGVVFTGPLRPIPIRGDSAVRTFLESVARGAKAVRPAWRVIDGERACEHFEFVTTTDIVVPVVECFHFDAGQITELHPYFDPRPLLAGPSQAAPSRP